jgi:4-amino-4-deoxy-L-arabinose transferase-like glycosyltransferase
MNSYPDSAGMPQSVQDKRVLPAAGAANGMQGGRACDGNASVCTKDVWWPEGVFLGVVIALAALLRVDFMRASSFVIDADEAIVGLMAKHIVEGGQIPVFYYGQHYMGSLEAILAAAAFSLFGMSSWSLQLVPLLCSLLLIIVMYFLGREFGGRFVARSAALLTALPPVALVVWSVKARGGFIEILLIGALAMLFAVRWWKAEAADVKLPISLGFTLGIGFWTNTQIIYFMGPIALFSLLFLAGQLGAQRCSWRSAVRVVVGGIAAFILGSAPAWIYNIERGFPSKGMFGFASLAEAFEHTQGLFSASLPILLGAKHFWELEPAYTGSTPVTYLTYGALLVWLLWLRRADIVRLIKGRPNFLEPVELLVLFTVFSCSVFVVSTFGWLVQAPRYLLPLYVAVFILCGYCAMRAAQRSRLFGVAVVGVLVTLNLLSAYAGGRAVPGEPVVYNGERVARDHSSVISTLERLGIRHLRTNYWIGYRLAFETGERITFSLFGAPYQLRIPQYEAFIAPQERNLSPILTVPAEASVVRDVLRSLGTSFSEIAVGGYVLFYSLAEQYPVKLVGLSSATVRAFGSGDRDFSAAVDGDSNTRWGTGAPQAAGQSFTVEFEKARVISGVVYDLGVWLHDYPRGLQISLRTLTGEVKTIFTNSQYDRVQLYLRENRGFSLLWPPVPITSITLTQTRSDPVYDWSIAELYVYEPRP